jgi:dephospho-CoA kinase
MFIIGLTGNIATGKSTIMKILAELGAEIIDADLIGREVQQPGGPAYLKVINAFGSTIVNSDGAIDRKKLGEIVFNYPDRLQLLEQIVHPLVVERIVERLKHVSRPVVVIEAIKLVEAGLAALCSEVWVVTSPKEAQVKRLREARGLKRSEALLRINAQPPQKDKVKIASVVFKNTGSLDDLSKQVEEEWARVQPPLLSLR